MKILVISLAGIGDTLFATPLIHELRANYPDAQLDAFVLWAGSRDVLEGNPHLNTVHQKNLINASKPEALKFLLGLRQQRYDISLNGHPQSRVHYRAVARVVNARLRASHDYDHATPFDRLLVNRTLKQDYEKHSIENNLALLDLIGAKPVLPAHDYEIFLSPADTAWAAEYLAANNLEGRQLIGIHVGSGGTKNLPLRRWPLASYIELIRQLNREHPDWAILLFGGPQEKEVHPQILAGTDPGKVFTPETKNLRQAAALIKRCHAFLSVDTVMMHLAAAMKVRGQVVIETPTWNKPIQPYNQKFTLIPNPAVAGRNLEYYRYDGGGIRGTAEELERCMACVEIERVYAAVSNLSSE